MPIDDDYLEELIRRWTASVKAIPIDDWSNDAYRSRLDRLRRRRRMHWRAGVITFVSVFLIVFAILQLATG